MAAFFLSDAGRTLGRVVDGAPDPATSTASEQLRWLANSALGAAEDGAFQADIERRFDVFQAHVRLIAGYDPRVVRAPTLVVSAEESTPLERWSPAPVANVRSVAVPGDHYTFLQPPSVSRVADAIRAAEGASIG
jgi:thioesterase domain-containing protein